MLKQNHRTTDKDLQKVIDESFTGELSAGSLELVLHLARPLRADKAKDCLVLKATNRECNVSRQDKMKIDFGTY